MSLFIVRVQLSKELQTHYTLLRDKLIKLGFTKRIKSKTGIEYRLPNGNYAIDSSSSIDEVFHAVQNTALSIDKSPMILVTESKEKGNTWAGLEKC